jgi:hypothetical protein
MYNAFIQVDASAMYTEKLFALLAVPTETTATRLAVAVLTVQWNLYGIDGKKNAFIAGKQSFCLLHGYFFVISFTSCPLVWRL